jgi:hypothetical protein
MPGRCFALTVRLSRSRTSVIGLVGSRTYRINEATRPCELGLEKKEDVVGEINGAGPRF